MELVQFDKHFVKKQEKRPHREIFWSFFSRYTLKTAFLNGKVYSNVDAIRAISSKIRMPFSTAESSPLATSCAPSSVPEHP